MVRPADRRASAYTVPTTLGERRMEREQVLKVMVPVAVFAVLLLIVGGVIAIVSGGGATPATGGPPGPQEPPPGATPSNVFGSVPLDGSGMTPTRPPLDAPEWMDPHITGADGLKIWDVQEGTEAVTATRADVVKVCYTGWRPDGVVFDGGPEKPPVQFSLTGVIAGWTYGIPGMKVGGIRRLYIPAKIAYGDKPPPRSNIPPNTDLIFEVKLLRVVRPN